MSNLTSVQTTPEEAAQAQQGDDTQQQQSSERPEWLPEKFNSPEDMAKAYSELESKLGQDKAEDQPAGKEGPQAASEDEARQQLQSQDIDYDALGQEFSENGELSVDSYKRLEDAGIPKDMVDAYIEGQQAIADSVTREAHGIVGGEDAYKSMHDWAASSLSAAEIEAFNKATMGSREEIMQAVRSMHARYVEANGNDSGKLINTNNGGDGGDVYGSWDEVMKDMQDPRYKAGDSAFHKAVQSKLSRSNI